jgi:hypothetical protein
MFFRRNIFDFAGKKTLERGKIQQGQGVGRGRGYYLHGNRDPGGGTTANDGTERGSLETGRRRGLLGLRDEDHDARQPLRSVRVLPHERHLLTAQCHPKSTAVSTNAFLQLNIGFPSLKLV